MTMKRILAAAAALVFVLSMAACGSKDNNNEADSTTAADSVVTEATPATDDISATDLNTDVTAADVTEQDIAEPDVSEVASQDVPEPGAPTEASSEAAESTTVVAGDEKKTPETVEEIVEFYKAAATETNKSKINAKDTMTLVSLDGGSGLVGGLVSAFEPIAKKALAKNSGPVDHVTGGFQNLTAADVKSAKATTSADGKYTNVRIDLKEQTDGMYGKSKEGHVGHGISILDGVQKAIDELNGVTVDTSQGDIKLHYNNAFIDVKIDNATGKIVSGKWHYQVNISIVNVKAKIGILSATLNDAKGVVEYQVTL